MTMCTCTYYKWRRVHLTWMMVLFAFWADAGVSNPPIRQRLSKLLLEFGECDIDVLDLEGRLDELRPLRIPMTLSQGIRIANPVATGSLGTISLRKGAFCSLQVVLLPEATEEDTPFKTAQGIRRFMTQKQFCSKPAYGVIRPRTSGSSVFKWTSCVLLLVGEPDAEAKTVYQAIFSRQTDNRDIHYFLLTHVVSGTSLSYVCRLCITEADVSQNQPQPLYAPVICHSPLCRVTMENTAEAVMAGGRIAVCYLASAIPPFEDTNGENSPGRTRTVKMRLTRGVLILPQHPAFHGLADLSFRDYRAIHRHKINFLRVNQAILSQYVSQNLSAIFPFSHESLAEFKPTTRMDPYLIQHHLPKTLRQKLVQLVYETRMGTTGRVNWSSNNVAASMVLTAQTHFTFLTCHGRYKAAPLLYYSHPFRPAIWAAISVTGLLVVCMLVTWSSGGINGGREVLNRVESLTCYTLALLLENNVGGGLVPRSPSLRVPRAGFGMLSLLCIVLGCLYKSLITTKMVLPLPMSIPFRSITDLTNFTLLALPDKDLRIKGAARDNVGERVMEPGNFLVQSSELVRLLHFRAALFRSEGLSDHLDTDILARTRMFENEEDVLSQMAGCETKAFVGTAQEVDEFLRFSRATVGLSKGTVEFMNHGYYWNVPYVAGGFVRRRLESLLSSGIYEAWSRAFYSRLRKEGSPELQTGRLDRKQSLDTHLGTLFKLICLGLAAAILVLFLETLGSLCKYHDTGPNSFSSQYHG